MSPEPYIQLLIEFVRVHQAWAAPVAFAFAFLELLALLSLVIPGWAALVALGALIGASGISLWHVWLAGAVGAALGDWVSYWLGYRLKGRVVELWPLSRHPDLIPRGHALVVRWGALAVFIGRFSGPFRASVPLVAGMLNMPAWTFQLANFSSALLWAWILLAAGGLGANLLGWLS